MFALNGRTVRLHEVEGGGWTLLQIPKLKLSSKYKNKNEIHKMFEKHKPDSELVAVPRWRSPSTPAFWIQNDSATEFQVQNHSATEFQVTPTRWRKELNHSRLLSWIDWKCTVMIFGYWSGSCGRPALVKGSCQKLLSSFFPLRGYPPPPKKNP